MLNLGTIAATTIILIMATNTSFADFPRLSALMAVDGFLPRQLAYRGSRLVYSRGIIALALMACLLIAAFDASVTGLIPLYAIGVFLSFTLSQAGMARRWWKTGRLRPGAVVVERGSTLRHDKSWLAKMAVNGLGSLMTAVVVIVFGVTKFTEGAWVVLIVIPLLAILLQRIHSHYRKLERSLSLDGFDEPPPIPRHRVIMLVGEVHRGTMEALRYSQTLSEDVTAVHVSVDRSASEKLRKEWEFRGKGVRLVILESPSRTFLEPVLQYIDEIARRRLPDETITIVVPQLVPKRWFYRPLHMHPAMMLRLVLLFKKDIVITDVPYLVS